MQAETIKDFLAKLGFSVDENSRKKFLHSLDQATKLADRLSLALVGAATAAAASSQKMASELNRLNYQAQRSRTTVSSLQAVGFAAERVGMSAEGVQGLVEGMRQAIRLQPGLAGLLRTWGIDPTQDNVAVFDRLIGRLRQMSKFIAPQFAQMFGIGPQQLLQLRQHYDQFLKSQLKGMQIQKEMGVDVNAAAKASTTYARSLTDVEQRVYTLREALLVALQPAMSYVVNVTNRLLTRFALWVKANKALINQRIIQFLRDFQTTLQKIPWREIGAGIEKFGHWMNWIAQHVGGWQNVIFGFLVMFALRLAGVATAASLLATVMKGLFAVLTPGKLGLLGLIVGGGLGVDYGLNKLTQHATKGKNKTWESWVREHLLGGSTFGIIGGTPSPKKESLPLGLRNNNPGNLMPGGHEAHYATMQQGLNAMAGLLVRYSTHGTNTLRKIISKYAPPGKNDTAAYIRNVSATLNINPDQVLDFIHHPETLARLQGAMIKIEQGTQPFGGAQLMASARTATSSAPVVNMENKTTINVNGSGDPVQAAREVSRAQGRTNTDLLHNMVNVMR